MPETRQVFATHVQPCNMAITSHNATPCADTSPQQATRGHALALHGSLAFVPDHQVCTALAEVWTHSSPQFYNSALESVTFPSFQVCETHGAILQGWQSILTVWYPLQRALASSGPFASDHGNRRMPTKNILHKNRVTSRLRSL